MLIERLHSMGSGNLTDEYLAIASNVELALLYAGALPGKDYTHLDLFLLAQPFVVEKFKEGSITKYDYPSDQVLGFSRSAVTTRNALSLESARL